VQIDGSSAVMERAEIVCQDKNNISITATSDGNIKGVDTNPACDIFLGSPQTSQSTGTSSPPSPTMPETAPVKSNNANTNQDNFTPCGDDGIEDGAVKWIEALTGAQVAGNVAQTLHTGQVLCELVNKIKPGTIRNINNAGMPFKERENISNFIKACRTLGVQEYALFSTDDLYDAKNMLSVIHCIHALGGAVQRTVPEFIGPHFGIPDKSNAKRDMKRDLGCAQQTRPQFSNGKNKG